MKRGGELKRKTPMSRGNNTLQAKAPMARGTSTLRARKPKSEKPKRAAREAEDRDLMDMCRGQPCYLLLPGIRCTPIDTVVPAHSNQSRHGKAAKLKAHNRYTVPGCAACHRELDQGIRFTKAEKFAFWDDAYARWSAVRDREAA